MNFYKLFSLHPINLVLIQCSLVWEENISTNHTLKSETSPLFDIHLCEIFLYIQNYQPWFLRRPVLGKPIPAAEAVVAKESLWKKILPQIMAKPNPLWRRKWQEELSWDRIYAKMGERKLQITVPNRCQAGWVKFRWQKILQIKLIIGMNSTKCIRYNISVVSWDKETKMPSLPCICKFEDIKII